MTPDFSETEFDLPAPEPDHRIAVGSVAALDAVALPHREQALRQCLKLLNTAREGPFKVLLISGDQGMGKSRLLEAFCTVARTHATCQGLDLRHQSVDSLPTFYGALVHLCYQVASGILDEALAAINALLQQNATGTTSPDDPDPQDLLPNLWTRQELLQAVSMVRIQQSLTGADATERLGQSLRNMLTHTDQPEANTLKAQALSHLTRILTHPWLLAATEFASASPAPPLQQVLSLLSPEAYQRLTDQAGRMALRVPEAFASDDSATSVPTPPEIQLLEPLIGALCGLIDWFSALVSGTPGALVLMIDGWETLNTLPEAECSDIKTLAERVLAHWSQQTRPQAMVVVTSRTGAQSRTLGGPLYNRFRHKLLLEPLDRSARMQTLTQAFRNAGISLDAPALAALETISQLSGGNPFWLDKLARFVIEQTRGATGGMPPQALTQTLVERLGLTSHRPEDILMLSLTRIRLAFVEHADACDRMIAALVRQRGLQAFQVADVVRAISVSESVPDLLVAECLRQLYAHDFVRSAKPANNIATSQHRGDTGDAGPWYKLQSPLVMDFLTAETASIETALPVGDKMAALRTILPMAIQSGELDTDKTREMITLASAMEDTAFLAFLEAQLLALLDGDARQDPDRRRMALDNLAVLQTPAALDALRQALSDADAGVRIRAANHLADCMRAPWPTLDAATLTQPLIDALDDPEVDVRRALYTALAGYAPAGDADADHMAVFLKGQADADEAIRLTAVSALAQAPEPSAMVRTSLIQAASDSSPAVRMVACEGLARFSAPEGLDVLLPLLTGDPDAGVRREAARAIARLRSPQTVQALIQALAAEPDEDVKRDIVKALVHHPEDPATEPALCGLLSLSPSIETTMPGLLWTCLQGLGQMATRPETLATLQSLETEVQQDIFQLTIPMMIQKIQARVNQRPPAIAALPNAPQQAVPLFSVAATAETPKPSPLSSSPDSAPVFKPIPLMSLSPAPLTDVFLTPIQPTEADDLPDIEDALF